MYELQSEETKHVIEHTCDIKLSLLTSYDEDGILDEVYDIEPTNEDLPNLTLVVMHKEGFDPKFVISYGVIQIPCPGLHTSEEIDRILSGQAEFPKPVGLLTKDVFDSTVNWAGPFISKFKESEYSVE